MAINPRTSAKPSPTAIVLISDTLCGMNGSGGVMGRLSAAQNGTHWATLLPLFYNGIQALRKKHAVKNLGPQHPCWAG